MSGSLLDIGLLDAVDAAEGKPMEVEAWRVAWKDQDVMRGGTEGRWNPALVAVPALYTSLNEHGAIAEVYNLLSRQPVFSSAEKVLHRLVIQTQNTLIIDTGEKVSALGLGSIVDLEIEQCRQVGEAAYRLDYDSLLVPSLRWECLNLVLFLDRLDPGDIQSQGNASAKEINWPAWIEENAEKSREFGRRLRRNRR